MRRRQKKRNATSQAVLALRKFLGLTQIQFARKIKVVPLTVVRWENRLPPTGETLLELADIASKLSAGFGGLVHKGVVIRSKRHGVEDDRGQRPYTMEERFQMQEIRNTFLGLWVEEQRAKLKRFDIDLKMVPLGVALPPLLPTVLPPPLLPTVLPGVRKFRYRDSVEEKSDDSPVPKA